MEKRKRWQSVVIIAAIALTIYNILPTIIYYAKPLSSPVSKESSYQIAKASIDRVNSLEKESIEWLHSYCNLLDIKPKKIEIDETSPQMIRMTFDSMKDSERFKLRFPRAAQLIPFFPSQMQLVGSEDESDWTEVKLLRKIPVRFHSSDVQNEFTYVPKFSDQGISKEYEQIVLDRMIQLGLSVGSVSENAQLLGLALESPGTPRAMEFIYSLAQNIKTYVSVFGENSPLAKRFYGTFTQGNFTNRKEAVQKLLASLEAVKDSILTQRLSLQDKAPAHQMVEATQQKIDLLTQKEEVLTQAIGVVKRKSADFAAGNDPWTYQELSSSFIEEHRSSLITRKQSPLIDAIRIDWNEQKIVLSLSPAILKLKATLEENQQRTQTLDQLNQLIIDEIAKVTRESGEELLPAREDFSVEINSLANTSGSLRFNLASLAQAVENQTKARILNDWNPESPDLLTENYPIVSFEEFKKLPVLEKELSLLLYSPSLIHESPIQGFKTNSVYVIAKGLGKVHNKYRDNPNSPEAEQFFKDFSSLAQLLQSLGFTGYPGTTFPLPTDFADDFIFEAEDFYLPFLQATRENYKVRGTKRFATLELSTLKQRILVENEIENKIQESLLKWRDEYQAAQVDRTGKTRFDVPKPTRNIFLSNLLISIKKYFRGDEKRILHWGLDLSGGKTVQIQLRDNNNRLVSEEADIKQAINELYTRVNKMGVSDVNIRQEGVNITLDFPGSQELSANELIKASSMTFQVVNEKFSTMNTTYADTVTKFLTEIWNEALVTGKKDGESINAIAWSHLNGDSLEPENAQPRSEAAKLLFNAGLRLPNPNEPSTSNHFDDQVSKIALYRGENYTDWHGQTHPLLIVFNNYALEGTNLDEVHAAYDPAKGNYLSFTVKGAHTLPNGTKVNPRKSLYTWTSVFSKEQIHGTPYENYSNGGGWRMAVILNGRVVSAPTLESALKDSAMISGNFSSREVNHLVSDLKAGSLSFVPQILSEKNVSPDLGMKERTQGVVATLVALTLVILAMTSYYRFAGVVASVAVLFNLLLIWATLQNIQASITLAGIAGIILTVGMAVDANVLVFERIREEFALTGRLAAAVHTGYKKAFSAILDSNVTTIIAAIILLNFDSGPIKGFAVTLIIGIASSMFSALFMTRYFFSKWVQNPKHKELKMANLISSKNFNFFRITKPGYMISALLAVVGCFFIGTERDSILGMDFTGGFAINIEVEKGSKSDCRDAVESALIAAGLSKQEFQIRELSPSNHLRVFLSNSLTKEGGPFYNMPLQTENDVNYSYENVPKLLWLVKGLEEGGVQLSKDSLKSLDKNFNSISGQMSDTMRDNALMGLGIALLCILLYITIRFEFKYAMSATLGLAYDLLMTLSILGILHRLGVPIQIDLNTVAALMTIVGYSLNDTIIVFDRIREDVQVMKKRSFKEVINHALNTTLSRTLLTSGTTLLVLVALVALGGQTIFGFSLIMLIGVVVGTISSCFIATSLLYLFQRIERGREEKPLLNGSH